MNNIHIGSLIKRKLEERKINITDFAKAIHCSRSNVYSIFDRKNINMDQLGLISQVLGCDFLSLYDEKPPQQCIIMLQTDETKLQELKADHALKIINSWIVSE
jgi:predicted transcriptional regulator